MSIQGTSNVSVFLECKNRDKANTQDSYFFGTLKKLPGWKLVTEGNVNLKGSREDYDQIIISDSSWDDTP